MGMEQGSIVSPRFISSFFFLASFSTLDLGLTGPPGDQMKEHELHISVHAEGWERINV